MIDDVRHGREWIITDRGKPVARLVPISGDLLGYEEWLTRMEDEGLVEPAPRAEMPLPPPLAGPPGWAQAYLQADRDDGTS